MARMEPHSKSSLPPSYDALFGPQAGVTPPVTQQPMGGPYSTSQAGGPPPVTQQPMGSVPYANPTFFQRPIGNPLPDSFGAEYGVVTIPISHLDTSMLPPAPPDQWMPVPPATDACQPGLEALEVLDSIQVERLADITAAMVTSMVPKVHFQAKNSGGLLVFKLTRDVASYDGVQNPTRYVISATNEQGMEPFRGIYSGEGCCGGCCSGSVCACTRAKEFSIHIPNDSEVATVEQKCSWCGIRYEVDNLDTMTTWSVVSGSCLWCYVTGNSPEFTVMDDTSGETLGSIRKVSDYQSDLVWKTYTYVVDFEPGLDAKTKAKIFMMSTYLAALYFEHRGHPNVHSGSSGHRSHSHQSHQRRRRQHRQQQHNRRRAHQRRRRRRRR